MRQVKLVVKAESDPEKAVKNTAEKAGQAASFFGTTKLWNDNEIRLGIMQHGSLVSDTSVLAMS